MEHNLSRRVVPIGVSKPRQLLSFDYCQEGLLSTNKCCCHVPDVLVGIVFLVGDAEQPSETLVFKGL
ncbi:hypothetical protein DPMN_082990 [Dreissena polymorpha]|uniref:Uncharacterized protein n=1 Tax=Dreissena polymorpha TaxID=45954 RepID=A0A9D4BHZ8_DREPO|nr:hypothetical protein DPMN_082990 [Dreissena polymorpha]